MAGGNGSEAWQLPFNGQGLHCGGRSCRRRSALAASSSEPPTSVGLACRPVGACRRHLVKQIQGTTWHRQTVLTVGALVRGP
jgi:hypothetical protein